MSNKKLDVLIVEDSINYGIELERLCDEVGLNVIGNVSDSANALDIIVSQVPDLILMDIEIEGRLSGLEIGEKTKHWNIPIIYITSFGDEKTILKAQQSNMIGFLVKPVSGEQIRLELTKVMKSFLHIDQEDEAKIMTKANNQRALFFMKNGVYHKIDSTEIVYIQAEDNYCRFVLVDQAQYLMRITLKEVEEILCSEGFLRNHRSFIVNEKLVTGILPAQNKIVLEGDHLLPFSRSKKTEVLKIGNFLK